MNHGQNQFSVRLLAIGALLAIAPMQAAWAGPAPRPKAPALGHAAPFALLGGSAVTCTGGAIIGNVGISSPGTADDFANTGCVITGKVSPATDAAADAAKQDFTRTYDALLLRAPSCIVQTGTLAGVTLAPGVYCIDAAVTGTLTLDGPPKGVWIFLTTGALTGTDFIVTMAGGGQACHVWWAPGDGLTMTTSALQGNILAGDLGDGSITLTGGTLVGRALADIAVTTTGTDVTVPAKGKGCPK